MLEASSVMRLLIINIASRGGMPCRTVAAAFHAMPAH